MYFMLTTPGDHPQPAERSIPDRPCGFHLRFSLDEINRWFFETNRDKPLAAVLRESRETFERVERAIAALPEADLLEPGRFPWLGGAALGPAVVSGTLLHYREEHEPAIRAWLARDRRLPDEPSQQPA